MCSEEDLNAVFRLCDETGKGFIESRDLVRVSSLLGHSSNDAVQQVLALLKLGPNNEEKLDFTQFCQRVTQAFGEQLKSAAASPVNKEGREVQAPKVPSTPETYETPEEQALESCPRMETLSDCFRSRRTSRIRRPLFSASNVENRRLPHLHLSPSAASASSATKKDLYRTLRRFQRQIEDLRELQVDTKNEILSLIGQQARHQEEELSHSINHFQAISAERLKVEKSNLEDTLSSEVREFGDKLEKLLTEKQTLIFQTAKLENCLNELTLKHQSKESERQQLTKSLSQIQTRLDALASSYSSLQDENRALTHSNASLIAKDNHLEEKVQASLEQLADLKVEVSEERTKIQEERMESALERRLCAVERQEVTDQIRQLAGLVTFLTTERDQEAANSLHGATDRGGEFEVAIEALEEQAESYSRMEALVMENSELSDKVDLLLREKKELLDDLAKMKTEKDDIVNALSSLREVTKLQKKAMVKHLADASAGRKLDVHLKAFEWKPHKEQERKYQLEEEVKAVTDTGSRGELCANSKLQEATTDISGLPQVGNLTEVAKDESQCSAVIIDDIRQMVEGILVQLEILEKLQCHKWERETF